ncbi:hypothetical protein M2152_001572 [Microbacteriaceae bacterium SG_E_30_P1]|uniref:Sensor histidine kinase n=1 Tax=Antiquaquibacter oligotrophicus TaxID=2880260 RepID=A0ABT6KNQ1_9MICO|nr:hypothetical protein [Antiquaquibacter oligotrophicus]MDH6181390.1 hypothetical protein [Antiquaquibacter oligotrophicus]UDF12918.1 hypothetical protein LH407_12255 [Antiquaquibacter oligotrophicus]
MNPSEEFVRPTAWQWDVRARVLQLFGVGGLIGLAASAIAGAGILAAVFAVVMLGFFAASVVLAVRVGGVARREQELGYSTIFDFPGYALRDGRTLELLRDGETPPETPGRRSLLGGMIATLRRDAGEGKGDRDAG